VTKFWVVAFHEADENFAGPENTIVTVRGLPVVSLTVTPESLTLPLVSFIVDEARVTDGVDTWLMRIPVSAANAFSGKLLTENNKPDIISAMDIAENRNLFSEFMGSSYLFFYTN
jgi:hypothetical protein